MARRDWLEPVGLLVLCLSTWRLSRMVTEEDGPAHVFRKVRELAGAEDNGIMLPWDEQSSFGKLVQCPYCLSVWAAAFLVIARAVNFDLYRLLVLSLTGSAFTVLIEEAKQ